MIKHFKSIGRKELIAFLKEADVLLQKRKKEMVITILGGASIILQGIRERATADIDIVNQEDAISFQKICAKLGMPVDIVSVSSTVDFAHAPTVVVFSGKALKVESVTAEDLIKLKLERFRKQDPEDIYAIIQKIGLAYPRFKSIVQEMLIDFVGNARMLFLSALVVVERMYPEQGEDFSALLPQ